jgi:branched-subunit amino acid transport protein AzlD
MTLFEIFDLLDRFVPNRILETLTIRAYIAHHFLKGGLGILETMPFSLLFVILLDLVKQLVVISLLLRLGAIEVHSELLS